MPALNEIWDKVFELQAKEKYCQSLADHAFEANDDFDFAHYSGMAAAYGDAAMKISDILPVLSGMTVVD